MAEVFNPLSTIILFEAVVSSEIEMEIEFKNYIFDYINIIQQNDTYDKIKDYMSNHAFTTRTENNTNDVKTAINDIIPKLKQLCDTDNMMEHFMHVLYLLEKK